MSRLIFSVRLVESFGSKFVPSGDSFADPGVAMDHLSSFPARLGPVVVRVSRAGRPAPGDAAVSGDWLCGDGPPQRLRGGAWGWGDAEASAWSLRRGALESWESCARADWMASAAASRGVDERAVAAAACDCVRLAAHLLPPGHPPALASLGAAEAWAAGGAEPSWAALTSAAAGVHSRARHGVPYGSGRERQMSLQAAAALRMLVAFCRAASAPRAARRPPVASRAQRAVSFAASAVAAQRAGRSPADARARDGVLSVMAAAVRGRVPPIAYLRASADRGP